MRLAACSLLFTSFIAFAPPMHAASKNPADYPLRIHVFRRNETTFYHNHALDEVKGEGRANLFENSEPKGIDFQYDCWQKLETSSGFETYPAKWKKPNEELTILVPEFGKTGSYSTCDLKVAMKDFAYYTHSGTLYTEPTAKFKEWMTRHDYDPEHGKDQPVTTESSASTPQGPPAPPPASAPSTPQ
jgi:hypothetical protein